MQPEEQAAPQEQTHETPDAPQDVTPTEQAPEPVQTEQEETPQAQPAPTEEPVEAPVQNPVSQDTAQEDQDAYDVMSIGVQGPPAGVDYDALKSIDWSQYQDENGLVDANTFWQVMQQQSQATVVQAEQRAFQAAQSFYEEQRLWDRTFEKYPDVKKDAELRRLVKTIRDGSLVQGKDMTPLQAAESIFKRVNTARQDGQQQAKEVIEVQDVATHLETSAAPVDNSGDEEMRLRAQIGSRDRKTAQQAQQELLKKYLSEGRI